MKSERKISHNKKSIELNFTEAGFINNITSKCTLSSENDQDIICNLNKGINGTYKLETFFISNENETLIIYQDNNKEWLSLQCLSKSELQVDTTDDSEKVTETPPERTDNSKKKEVCQEVQLLE